VFVCRDDFEAGFFVDLNNTGGPVDVWEVTGIGEDELVTWNTGFCYVPAPIPPAQVTLVTWPGTEPVPSAERKNQRPRKPKKKPRAGT
jgi:hypothetical protein